MLIFLCINLCCSETGNLSASIIVIASCGVPFFNVKIQLLYPQLAKFNEMCSILTYSYISFQEKKTLFDISNVENVSIIFQSIYDKI